MYGETNIEKEYREKVYNLLSLEDSFFCFGHLDFRKQRYRRSDYKQQREDDFNYILLLTCKELDISKGKVCVVLKHEITKRHSITNCNGHLHFLISSYGLKKLDKGKFIKTFSKLWKEHKGRLVMQEFNYDLKKEGLNYSAKVKKNGEFVFDGIKISPAMERRLKWLSRHSLNGPRMPSTGFSDK
tara:strand:+ start:1383 stop:1937 length:555 start_codon:yes stop_codon:yes gene_type:complete